MIDSDQVRKFTYKDKELKESIYLVLKKDMIFLNDNNVETDDNYNIYRVQLGMCYGLSENQLGQSENFRYIVFFQDKEADRRSITEGINELEIEKNDLIPLVLIYPGHPFGDIFTNIYEQDYYMKPENKGEEAELEGVIFQFQQPENEELEEATAANPDSKSDEELQLSETENAGKEFLENNLQDQDKYENVSCYDTNRFIHHNKTDTQFDSDSLVTLQEVFQAQNAKEKFLYPGQVGLIIGTLNLRDNQNIKSNQDYVRVIFLPQSLNEWNDLVDFLTQNQNDFNKLKKEKYGLIVYINKYNLVPIFQTELTLTETGKMQIQEIQKFSTLMEKCTSEEYRDQLQKQCERMNVANEDYEEQLKLFENLKLFFSK